MTTGPYRSRLKAHWSDIVFWLVFVVFAGVLAGRNVQKNWRKDQIVLRDTQVHMGVSDFECFYRGALRMQRGEIMYWPDTEEAEMPTMLLPFQQLLLVPLTPFPPWLAEVFYGLVSWGLLAATIVLGGRLLERARGAPVSPWLTRIAFLLLIPYVNLVGRYNQTGFFLMFPVVAGLVLLPRRPLAAGFVLALPAAMKLIPLVLLPWLLWKRSWRASFGFVLCLVATSLAFVLHQGPTLAKQQLDGYIEMIRADRGFEHYNERFQGFPNFVRATVTPKYETDLDSKAQAIGWDGVRNFVPSEFLYDNAAILVLIAGAVIVLGCAIGIRSRWPDSDRRRLGEVGLVLVAMLLLSPHTWKHYYWFLFPALLFVLLEFTERRRWAGVALGVVLLTLTLPHRGTMPYLWMWAHVFHIMVIGTLLLWAILVWRLFQGRSVDPLENPPMPDADLAPAPPEQPHQV